ncbi:ImmA/IrrE family metallo-endopeptidase [Geotalea sp. SG265]|uniref:ImmA/IrrE family metallo-endopeptidase n=1 Tax=Geotalea sp. SG265 TaxID=2922867 RepID=UPI00325FDBD9
MSVEEGAFSAVTVFHGSARVIVHNNAHAKVRQTSDVAHELSHALLHHPPMPAFDHRGCRDWDDELEDEAKWLAGTLLIPEEAALQILRRGMSIEDAAGRYNVSQKMVQYRLNVTGAYSRVQRERAWRRR